MVQRLASISDWISGVTQTYESNALPYASVNEKSVADGHSLDRKPFWDALRIYDYISGQSLAHAGAVYERIPGRLVQLIKLLCLDQSRPNLVATILVNFLFRLIYRIGEEDIRFPTIIHGSQRLLAWMVGEEERERV